MLEFNSLTIINALIITMTDTLTLIIITVLDSRMNIIMRITIKWFSTILHCISSHQIL
jgi:hypothetical protein